jgi:hypothetical protein
MFRENIADATTGNGLGGAATVFGTGPIIISENTFEGNIAKSRNAWAEGGALLIDDEPPASGYGRKMVVDNRFVNNLASSQFGNGTGGAIEAGLSKYLERLPPLAETILNKIPPRAELPAAVRPASLHQRFDLRTTSILKTPHSSVERYTFRVHRNQERIRASLTIRLSITTHPQGVEESILGPAFNHLW